VHFSGKKWDEKLYRWHTGYPGGLKERPAKHMHEKKPDFVLRKAVLGMLQRNNLRQSSLEPRLKIYAGPDHPHAVQLPPGAEPLPPHPRRRRGTFHFGLGAKYSATPFVQGSAKARAEVGE
jgi:large subunit ribosomal protein L13